MNFKEILSGRVNPEGIEIKRKNYSPSGDLPLPLALKRAGELKQEGGRMEQFMRKIRRNR